MLVLYGHPFSSYTWKVLIALYANATAFEMRILDADHPEHAETVRTASPLGTFPVLLDGGRVLFESSVILAHLDAHHPGPHRLISEDADTAIAQHMLDRVFDNAVMTPVQAVVAEHLRVMATGLPPDAARCAEARARLTRAYAWLEDWLEGWLATSPRDDEAITLVECAAAPALFYADWVAEIGPDYPRLKAWRAHLLALPAVARCVEEARPYRAFFPPGAPDRD